MPRRDAGKALRVSDRHRMTTATSSLATFIPLAILFGAAACSGSNEATPKPSGAAGALAGGAGGEGGASGGNGGAGGTAPMGPQTFVFDFTSHPYGLPAGNGAITLLSLDLSAPVTEYTVAPGFTGEGMYSPTIEMHRPLGSSSCNPMYPSPMYDGPAPRDVADIATVDLVMESGEIIAADGHDPEVSQLSGGAAQHNPMCIGYRPAGGAWQLDPTPHYAVWNTTTHLYSLRFELNKGPVDGIRFTSGGSGLDRVIDTITVTTAAGGS